MPQRRAFLSCLMAVMFFLAHAWDFIFIEPLLIPELGDKAYTKTYGGRWKYLTFICLCCCAAYWSIMAVVSIVDLIKGETWWSKRHHWWLSMAHASVVTPLSSFVAVSFWAIFLYNKPLIWPPILQRIVPQWLNHCRHTLPVIAVYIDKVMTPHVFPNRMTGACLSTCCWLCYTFWIFWIAAVADLWVYPFLEWLTWTGRGIFVVATFVLQLSLYVVSEKVSAYLWPQHHSSHNHLKSS